MYTKRYNGTLLEKQTHHPQLGSINRLECKKDRGSTRYSRLSHIQADIYRTYWGNIWKHLVIRMDLTICNY
uniref:Uncharacterized protein n=1 Tax=Arundo donax TaxID=35708 RepID=A0A0A9FEB3_ARUDO